MLEQASVVAVEEVAKATLTSTVTETVKSVVVNNPISSGIAIGVVATVGALWLGKKLFGNKGE